jgi:hypothetical protein
VSSVAVIVSPFELEVKELFDYVCTACCFLSIGLFAASVKKETKFGKKLIKLPKLCPHA